MKEKEVVLQLEHVFKSYDSRSVVKDISLSVHAGEIFGFLGANGAGKSTTMKMICGLTSITSGDIFICGHSVKKKFEKAMANVGCIIENPTFYDYMSGLENLRFFASLHENITENDIKEVTKLVGLQNRIKDKVRTYSLGMKQRLGIAQAILHRPKLIILDEPTNGLDATGIVEIRNFLKNLAKSTDTAILVSSHILPEMENLCDNIAILSQGVIKEYRSIYSIRSNLTSEFNQFIKVDAPNLVGKILKEKYGIRAGICGEKVLFSAKESMLCEIIIELTKSKISIYAAGPLSLTLEDLFMNVTRGEGGIR